MTIDKATTPPLTGAELDEIETIALAAPKCWYGTYQIADGISDEKAVALIEACSPDTVLALIAQARAQQAGAAPAEPFGQFHTRRFPDGSTFTFQTRDDDPDSFPLYASAVAPSDAKGKADAASAGGQDQLEKWIREAIRLFGSAMNGMYWKELGDHLKSMQEEGYRLLGQSPATSASDAKDAERDALRAAIEALPVVRHLSGDDVLYRDDVLAAIAATQQAAAVAKDEQSDLTTIQCPVCVALPGLGCDECHGQGRIIVSRADLAEMEAQSSAKGGDAVGGEQP